MSTARSTDEVVDEEVRAMKKLKKVVVDDLQRKTDEELAELISMNKRNVGLLELVLPNKAQALKEAINSHEDEIHRRAANLLHCPKNGVGRVTSVVPVKIEVNDQQLIARCGNVGENVAKDENAVRVELAEMYADANQSVEVNVDKKVEPKQRGRKKWDEAEETSLAMAYISTPANYVVGNSQQGNMCWSRLISYFNQYNISGIQRNEDQIKSKWRDMDIKVAKFNEIFTRVMNERKSGCSDCVRQIYKQEVGTYFTLEHVWKLLKNSPKWKSRVLMDQPSERTKTFKQMAYTSSSSSSSSSSDDDHDNGDDDDAHGSINLEDDKVKHKCPSSNKSPNGVEKSKETSSSSTSSKVYEAFLQSGQIKDDDIVQLKETLDLRNKLRQEKLKVDAEKVKNQHFAFLLQDTSGLTGIDLDIVLRRKEEVRNMYNDGLYILSM